MSVVLAVPAALGTNRAPSTPDNSSVTEGPAPKPNIIVIYMDDVGLHDGRLWSDPTITPTLYDLFVDHGVEFTNAIGETPLCCPARGALLTGLHTHNHGVTVNDARLFNPGEHVGKELKAAGYNTSIIGKYLNNSDQLSNAQWQTHAAGWSNMDVFMTPLGANGAGYFYDYTLFTKQGPVAYPDTHSTQMIADRSVARMREVAPDKPIFQLLSIYDTHAPNTPLPLFVDDPKCDSMLPWNPPSYNEADMSDKPPFMQSLPLLRYPDGFPMNSYCRGMQDVDWLTKQVVDELTAEGRLDNTLLVFTSDNGMGWGEHRWPQKKRLAYTTPVPLYMSWPARWGNTHRVITDGASNIDFAPTFCDYGGCTLGPYPTGQTHPDGISLKPVLDGTAATLGRDALLEEGDGSTPWYGLRTTPSNPLGHWHYVVQPDGFEELYDLQADPWELQNVSSGVGTADLRSQLAARLAQLLQEGRVGSGPRPDASVGVAPSGPFYGVDIYATTAKASQTAMVTDVLKFSTHDFLVRIYNHGPDPASFSVQGTSTGSTRINVQYLVGTLDVTNMVKAGTLSFDNVPTGTDVSLTVRMIVGKAPALEKRTSVVTAIAKTGLARLDVVRATVVRAAAVPPPASPPAPPAPPPS